MFSLRVKEHLRRTSFRILGGKNYILSTPWSCTKYTQRSETENLIRKLYQYLIFTLYWKADRFFEYVRFIFKRMEIAFKLQRNQQKLLKITKVFCSSKLAIFQIRFFRIDNCGAKMLWAYYKIKTDRIAISLCLTALYHDLTFLKHSVQKNADVAQLDLLFGWSKIRPFLKNWSYQN